MLGNEELEKTFIIENKIINNKGMKRIIVVFCLLIVTIETWGQSIGGALSNGSQSTSMSQHSIIALDLKKLCVMKTTSTVFGYLEKMGWSYQGTSTSEDFSTTTWALDLDYYDEDKAMAWLYVTSDLNGVEMVSYRFASEKFIRTFEQTIEKAGFRPFDYSKYGDDIIAGYQSPDCFLILERDGRSHNVKCIRKRGRYDKLNGKKKESLEDGGYVIYTLVDGEISGLVQFYNEGNVLKEESVFLNGERNGQSKSYHSDGKTVAGVGNYKNGKAQGTFYFYTEQGNVWKEITFEDGIRTILRLYEGDHNLSEEDIYDFQGNIKTMTQWKYRYTSEADAKGCSYIKEITDFTGDQPVYKKYLLQNNTEMLVESIVKDGQCLISGRKRIRFNEQYLWAVTDSGEVLPQSIFTEDGRADERIQSEIYGIPAASICIITLKDGEPNGPFRCYVDTNIHRKIYLDRTITDMSQITLSTTDTSQLQLYCQGMFSNGAATGQWKTYNPLTGNLSMDEFYQNAERNGEAHYYREGRIETCHFSEGKKDGYYSYQDRYGMNITGNYINDMKNGDWTWSTSESSERATLSFKDNERSGMLNMYNRNGTLVCSAEYYGGVQHGNTHLYDTNGNLCFRAFLVDGTIQSIVDYRNKDVAVVNYSNLQEDYLTICFEKDGENTSITYQHPVKPISFNGCSTLEMAFIVDSIWTKNTLFPATVEHTNAQGVVTVRGRFENGEKKGVWTFKYPEQGVLVIINYDTGNEKFLTLSGEPYSGIFELLDYNSGIKVVKKIKKGIIKKQKMYDMVSGKRYREPFDCDYFPIQKKERNYIFRGIPDMDSLSSININWYTNYSDNWLTFHMQEKPSFQPSVIDQAVLWPQNMPNRAIALYKTKTNAHFPGGETALRKYLNDIIVYPELARTSDISGVVLVSFIVEKDGTISNATVLRDIGGGCGREALRVVESMPKWISAEINGEKTRTQIKLPVSFSLK